MASVLQQYRQLADHMATQITGSYQSWTDFLATAARLYKYPYHEQLMIYAQRPDATACADYELWNKRMGRYVRRGAKGIALIDHSGDAPKLKYVFDVADTRSTERSRSPYLWEYRPEHERAVSAALEEQFAVPNDGSITEQLEQISSVKVTEYFLAHQQDILGIVDGSYLEGYHDYDKGVAFINVATVSTTYALLSRCGLAADAHLDPEEFMPVFDFNTPQTVFALGSAVSEISEKVLRSIEVTIKKYEREKLSERSQENERTDLHTQRGLLDSRSEPVPAGDAAPGQVREDAESLPSGVSPGAVEQPDPVREAVPPSEGDRRDSEPAVGADDARTDAVGGGDRSSESQRPHEMGGADEQPKGPGGGSDSDGAYLRLTDEPPIQGEQFSFNIHNYFFAKGLDQVRPGGVVAFVTSRYTMDAQNPSVRKYLAQRADLLGAIRLPNTAFKANAGTEVVSDIIFLQKRDRPIEIDPDWVHLGQTEDGYAINSYFLGHPEMVMGRNSSESTAHGMDYTVEPFENISLASSLQDAVQHIQGTYQEAEPPDLGEGETIQNALPADPDVKNFSYTLVDGEVYFRENSIMVRPDLNATAKERIKCRYMDELTGNRGVVFATGTPVSNSMTELYTMQRYLQYARLEEMHMTHFDCWASRFGETVTALELAPEGKGYRPRTRFSRFFNLPELMNLFKEVADIKTADQLHLPVPRVEYHNVVAKPTEVQQGLVQELSERAAAIHSGSVDPSIDNMLKVTSDGRKLGLDQRIINPDFLDEAGSKVNLCVDNILQVWQDGEADKLTQLVFCDISTPQAAPKAKQAVIAGNPLEAAALPAEENAPFTVYDDIRSKLIAGGVPAEQIAFIHDANTEVKKKELFGKVRSGQVRVLLGSTSKMGAGTNVQDRLVAIHDLDCPWRPGDLQQRKGRIERQGNQNEKVHVFRYVTEGTFDAFLWQTVENKQKFISQIMTSKSPVRSCNDVDEVALSFAEIKALCAGDPRIKERMDLDVEVSRLKIMKADHKSKQYRLEDSLLRHFPEQVEKLKGCIQAIQEDMNTLEAHPHPTDGFAGMTVLADELTDKDNAGAALIEAAKKATGLDPVEVGTYRGFQMSVTLEDFGKKYVLTMQGRLKHQAILGSDPRGNLIRLDNALAQMPQRLKAFQTQLDETCHQQEAAKAELGKPFPFEEELRDKTARLIFLDAELNLDANKGGQTEQVIAKSARPSVLDKLRSQPAPIRNNQKQKRHEEVR